MVISREPQEMSNNKNSLGMKLLENSKLIVPSSVAVRLLFLSYSEYEAVGFQDYCGTRETEVGIEHIKIPESSLFLPRFSWVS